MKKTLALIAAGLLATALPATAADLWRRIDNPAPIASGADGKPHTASCSAYPGTDPTFRFWTRRGKSSNLVVYFEGGGACWDDLTCTFPFGRGLPGAVPQFYSPAVAARPSPKDDVGLFDETQASNPLKDWTVVYIPYCTGDIHLGSAKRTYNDYGHPIYNLPPTFEIRHSGFDNFMVVFDWMKKNLRTPNQVLVTGSSAGGYGATGNFPWVAETYPQAKLSVLADASQGVTTAAFDGGTPGRGSWNPQLAPWVFGSTLVPGPQLMRKGAQAYPGGRFAQYTTALDGVQAGFYGVMKQFYGPGGSCTDINADWNQQMLSQLASDNASLPNFRSYVAPGTSHTILRSTAFYAENGTGRLFNDWVADMLAGSTGWQSAACPDCLNPVPCP